MVDKVLDIVLYEKDFSKAINFVQGKIFDLFNNRVDISDVIISKGLTRNLFGDDGYKVNLPHVALAYKIIERNKGENNFNIGDRIPYVITALTKNAKQYEKSEDPLYTFNHKIPLDLNYYLDKQIKPPLERIFKVVMNTKDLFEGIHTLKSKKQKASKTKGMGMYF